MTEITSTYKISPNKLINSPAPSASDPDKNSTVTKATDPNTGDDNYSISFIDVGQGDAILIETSQRHFILIDSGPSDKNNRVNTFLRSKGVSSIDKTILTHGHADHYGEFKNVIKSFVMGSFIFSGYPNTNKTYAKMFAQLNQKPIPTFEYKDGNSFTVDNLTFSFYHPPASGFINTSSDENDNSLAIKVSNQSGIDFLTNGDLEIEGITSLLTRHCNDVDIELLKINHHGSSNGTTQEWLDATTPIDAFISVGQGNKYKHPHEATLKLLQTNGIRIHRTDREGNIEVEVTGKNYNISTEKP